MNKIALLLFVGFFVVASCQEKSESQIPEGAFPIIYTGHLYIKGTTDSIEGNYVFDTGASNLYIDSTHYADNGFAYENTFTAMLPGAGSTPQKVDVIADTVHFKFGENLYQTTIIPVLRLKPILGDIADGILGMEYFHNSVLEINYEKEYMKIYTSIDSVDVEGWSKIAVINKKNRLFIPLQVSINDSTHISGEFQLDFGSGGSISFTSFVSNKYNLKQNIKNKASFFTKYGGIGGESSSYDFIADSLKIGDFKFENVVMDFSVDKAGALASSKHFGLLGNAIYERFNLYIDFINNNLYLMPNKNYHEAFEPSRLGFSYVDRGQTLKSWIVTGLYDSSNAEQAGLKIDDKILRVNGVNVSEINYELQESYFDDVDEISLGIERNNRFFEITFNLESVISVTN